MEEKTTFVIAGPTASGKSDLAVSLAERTGGEVVNADAMQVYEDLEILTARPDAAMNARAPHHLYGFVEGQERFSAGRWVQAAAAAINDIHARDNAAIIVGGTGMYFGVLLNGLSPIPDIADEFRELALARRSELGAAEFHRELVARDPAMERLEIADAQRVLRAWEVFEATGVPLSQFQERPREKLISLSPKSCVLAPAREQLYGRCDARAASIMTAGAMDEVKALLARELDDALPIMKALGVAECRALLVGESDEAQALAALQQSTRRFAKRQLTWFRNQTPDWPVFDTNGAAIDWLDP